ncbi:hypothetical protein N0V94_000476 [Neodidymelliopsis sp. IMI 364377]|nr:hypothetical protein N0V94_000476 [Neodidymelliopsis sp. IMI 364377]
MTRFSLDDLDKHIENLRAQLQFLNEGLDATDHNAPDWLATDLLSLRNKSGRLQDDMKRFRDQLETEGLTNKRTKNANKRLSIEGTKPPESPEGSSKRARLSIPGSERETAEARPDGQHATLQAKPAQVEPAYTVQHIDVTEEVNRRLQESRLRRLMETPSTAQKRKFENFEDLRIEGGSDLEEDTKKTENDGMPAKRMRNSGTFEPIKKRKIIEGRKEVSRERFSDRTDFKRRKL